MPRAHRYAYASAAVTIQVSARSGLWRFPFSTFCFYSVYVGGMVCFLSKYVLGHGGSGVLGHGQYGTERLFLALS